MSSATWFHDRPIIRTLVHVGGCILLRLVLTLQNRRPPLSPKNSMDLPQFSFPLCQTHEYTCLQILFLPLGTRQRPYVLFWAIISALQNSYFSAPWDSIFAVFFIQNDHLQWLSAWVVVCDFRFLGCGLFTFWRWVIRSLLKIAFQHRAQDAHGASYFFWCPLSSTSGQWI